MGQVEGWVGGRHRTKAQREVVGRKKQNGNKSSVGHAQLDSEGLIRHKLTELDMMYKADQL